MTIYNPKWQQYFLSIANAVAQNSKCRSRKIGAVLVRDKSVIATGYNGPARDITSCWDCNRPEGGPLNVCPAAHAEVNCIANAARMGVCTADSTMFVTCEIPCKDCLSTLINAGIKLVYVTELKFYDNLASYILDHGVIKAILIKE